MAKLPPSAEKYKKLNAELVEEIKSLRARVESLENNTPTGAQASDIPNAALIESLEGLENGLAIFDADDRLVYCNESYRAHMGVATEFMKPGITFEELTKFRIREGLIAGASADTDAWLRERLIIHRRGGQRLVRQRPSDGRVFMLVEYKTRSGGTVSLRTDVTDQVRAEDSLRRSEERFRAALENSIVGISLNRPEFDGRLINHALYNMLGYTAEEMQGKNLQQLRHPDESLVGKQQRTDFEKGSQKSSVNVERFIHKSGGIIWCETSRTALYDAEGNLVDVLTIRQDITERKIAEEARRESESIFKSIFESADAGMSVLSVDQKIRLRNAALSNMLGYTREEFEAIKMRNLAHPDDGAKNTRQRLAAGVLQAEYDKRYRHRDGHYITCHVIGSTVVDDAGRALYSVTLFRDITEQNRVEEQLRQAQKMETVGQLTGGVAHDFNNLLQIIGSNIQMAQHELVTGRISTDAILEYLGGALDAGKRGGTLVQQLLAFSRVQTLSIETVDPRTFIPETIKLLERTLGEDIEISATIDDDVPVAAIDRTNLTNAILNIAINAQAAMPDGGRLSICARRKYLEQGSDVEGSHLPAGEFVEFSVTDTGCGMSDETLRQAVEPFYTTKPVGEGSGLGLSMVYGFARQSGGQLILDSAIGKGTTVRLLFPVEES